MFFLFFFISLKSKSSSYFFFFASLKVSLSCFFSPVNHSLSLSLIESVFLLSSPSFTPYIISLTISLPSFPSSILPLPSILSLILTSYTPLRPSFLDHFLHSLQAFHTIPPPFLPQSVPLTCLLDHPSFSSFMPHPYTLLPFLTH